MVLTLRKKGSCALFELDTAVKAAQYWRAFYCNGSASPVPQSKQPSTGAVSTIELISSMVLTLAKNGSCTAQWYSLCARKVVVPGSSQVLLIFMDHGENVRGITFGKTVQRGSSHGNGKNTEFWLKLGFGLGGTVLLIVVLSIYITRHRIKGIYASPNSRYTSSDPSSKSDLEAASAYFGVPVFSYSELAEATNNFNHEKELGDGGFGTVYYGKLRDGREVAVKRLYEHNYRRVEQFMNEIKILTRLRHKNLVSLYGCTSRHSQGLLLVYEFIPNGTIANHLHGDRANPCLLTWPIRMNIAIETASALAYLHASDIIHRDVKTNNILLDNNFCVKVVDFGLSRLFPTDVTHVSTAPQGTPSYVDPEYHQCYQLTREDDDDKKELKSVQQPPPSPPHSEESALLKNIMLPPSPISVTENWISNDTTPNVSN
ncbi:hypothetical protein EZV62_018642 [Acer yangbiense]|uniref:Protein kinase domain-containing protein n=1 Tax=Acer yangbiense TaxID=1000413 RepID=A0A5C7HKI1_9ROSI|nr:hypothetical protein EZV62_018642 [Acer yangbiense]